MKTVFDKDFRYTPVRDQGPGYLKRKFDAIRKQLKTEAAAKVLPLDEQRRQIREMSATLRGRKPHV